MTDPLSPEAAALVRAIRRAHGRDPWSAVGVVEFHIRDVYDFAERLARLGVMVDDSQSEEAA